MTSRLIALEEELSVLQKRSQNYLSDWLTAGLVGHYAHRKSGAFYPHSFVTGSDDPIDTLIEAYEYAMPTLQRRLRRALMFASAALVPDSSDYHTIEMSGRYVLLRACSELIRTYGCFEAAGRIVASVVDWAPKWREAGILDEAFAVGLKCVADLAIEGEGHSEWDRAVRADLESILIRMIASEHFKPSYAPLCIHALVVLNPEGYLSRHRENLGLHIQEMHRCNPEQKSHAYATVNIILNRALRVFIDLVPTMDVSGPTSTDAWIFDALMSEKSEFVLSRRTRDPSIIHLSRSTNEPSESQTKPRASLTNMGFIHLTLKGDLARTLPAPKVALGRAAANLTGSYAQSISNLLYSSPFNNLRRLQ